MTSNPEAAGLILQAQAKCEGCRIVSWRLHGWTHNGVYSLRKVECTAKEERQALRDIAKRPMAERVYGAPSRETIE